MTDEEQQDADQSILKLAPSALPGSVKLGPDLSSAIVPSAPPLSQLSVPNAPPQTAQQPQPQITAQDAEKHGHPNIASRNPDGSVTFQDGVKAYQDGHIEYKMNGEDYSETPDGKRYRKQPRLQFRDLIDQETSQPYTALIDTKSGNIVKRIEEPSARAWAQANQVKMRIQNLTKAQPGVADYITTKNNYDSLLQNSQIPNEKRTPADDNTAIQAFGMIEHPRSSVTDMDKKMGQSMVPIWSKAGLAWHNLTRNDARILDAPTVTDMTEAGRRGFESRKKTYYEQIMPMVKDALSAHLDPNEVIGANVWPDPYKSSPQGSPAPSSSPQANSDQGAMQFVQQHSDPKDPMFTKAQQIAEVLKKKINQNGGQPADPAIP